MNICMFFSFEENGYDNINYIGGDVLTKEDLADIGITNNKAKI